MSSLRGTKLTKARKISEFLSYSDNRINSSSSSDSSDSDFDYDAYTANADQILNLKSKTHDNNEYISSSDSDDPLDSIDVINEKDGSSYTPRTDQKIVVRSAKRKRYSDST